uniref:Uncharacterized protein n=1 Tax=Oryza glumipatula TaxID=40148 RepID=A0A0D9ZW87_9ORYZ
MRKVSPRKNLDKSRRCWMSLPHHGALRVLRSMAILDNGYQGASAFERLMIVMMQDLACCTQLPNSLCHLPCLKFFQVMHAPAIKRVGPKFMTIRPSSSQHHHGAHEWEWEWDQQPNNVQTMPALEELTLENCKLRSLPPGLSSEAIALTSMDLYKSSNSAL